MIQENGKDQSSESIALFTGKYNLNAAWNTRKKMQYKGSSLILDKIFVRLVVRTYRKTDMSKLVCEIIWSDFHIKPLRDLGCEPES